MNPAEEAIPPSTRDDTLLPSLAIVASTVLWGTWWYPLRQLDLTGVGNIWASAGGFLLPLLVCIPFLFWRRRALFEGGQALLLAGFFTALAVALYAEALLRGQVARVMLLFYLTPVWSALLGRWLLGERVTPRRMLTIVLGMTGVAVVVGIDRGLFYPQAIAEWMGLLSGIAWALAMVHLQRSRAAAFDKTLVQFLFVGVLFIGLALIPGGREWSAPSLDLIGGDTVYWLIALAFIWTLPALWLTIFGGSGIDPARVAVLLMLEIVIGLISAALLTDEPFGWREGLGAVLIIGAGAVEMFTSVKKHAPAS